MFSMVKTMLNIAFATFFASCFAKNLGNQHIEAIKTFLQYLKGFNKWKISYCGQNKLLVKDYSDSDWAIDKENRKSTSGFIFILNSGPVS